ncbi:MAG: ABC transporter permease subunit [Clostridia bacterium]|nr:ABC transporter permease subunit [Clostridia bacterium]
MKKEKKNSSGLFGCVGNWFSRMFFGASKRYAEEIENKSDEDKSKLIDVEEIISPGKQVFKRFCQRKMAIFAVFVVIAMFLTVFIAPCFMPNYSDTYTETTQQNIPPTMSFLSVPRGLRNDIKMIDTYGTFTVGLSNAGKVYVWGHTKLGTTGIDISDIPDAVKNAKIEFVAAGYDHIVAIDSTGKVHAWGNNRLGQYGYFDPSNPQNSNIMTMPYALATGGRLDISQVKKLDCGYQATVILMNDGSYFIWGNKNAYGNLERFVGGKKFVDISFTLNNVVAIDASSPNYVYTAMKGVYGLVRDNLTTAKGVDIKEYIADRSIVSLSTTNNMVCLILSDGSVCFAGDIVAGYSGLPTLEEGETVIQAEGGIYHFTFLTSEGNVYSIGSNKLNQCKVPAKASNGKVTKIFAGSLQSYAVDEDSDLVAKWGLKGYIFGTDKTGAPIFERVINGGKMTMTVGAVAVIISSIIGILVGCISGYFGGKVDIILMRVTEIFSAIPFLPFALILSALMGRMTISETMRIFIIMCILGVLSWTGLARLVRGQVLVARENEYVMAAKAMGVKESRIAFKHILPNVISVIVVTLTLDFAGCMLTESSLSYLGFGVQYPRPTWGNMLNAASNSITIKNFWWQWVFPALFLAVTTICINIIGDTIRDAIDPKSNSER